MPRLLSPHADRLAVEHSDTGGEITGLTRRINYDEKSA